MSYYYSKEITLNSVTLVKNFVNIATRYTEDIDVCHDRYMIDGKSIMGMYSLDLSRPVKITIHTSDTNIANKFFQEVSNMSNE